MKMTRTHAGLMLACVATLAAFATGALDPLATGMLPICLGEATKFSQYLLDADKGYETVAQLGVTTTTGDAEGEVLQRCAVDEAALTSQRLAQVAQQFTGAIRQVPPCTVRSRKTARHSTSTHVLVWRWSGQRAMSSFLH